MGEKDCFKFQPYCHDVVEESRIKGEDGGRARLVLLLPLRNVAPEGEDEDEELDEVTPFCSLVNFFFSLSQGLSSIL